ncbi:MAG: hypothetical protein KME31_22065 [Tolypothrix carrinoi HA7290-LM1]|nr:hypothetical protein [Tolypothrix carrinoi HA7290-LM1]
MTERVKSLATCSDDSQYSMLGSQLDAEKSAGRPVRLVRSRIERQNREVTI